MDRGAWEATIQGVAKSRTQLSDFHMIDRQVERETWKKKHHINMYQMKTVVAIIIQDKADITTKNFSRDTEYIQASPQSEGSAVL